MGVSDQKLTRLKLLMILFIFTFAVVACELMFFGSTTNMDIFGARQGEVVTGNTEDIPKPEFNIITGAAELVIFFAFFIGFVFQLLTFTIPSSLPLWINIIVSPIMTVILIIEIYIILDMVYDFVKALPLT